MKAHATRNYLIVEVNLRSLRKVINRMITLVEIIHIALIMVLVSAVDSLTIKGLALAFVLMIYLAITAFVCHFTEI